MLYTHIERDAWMWNIQVLNEWRNRFLYAWNVLNNILSKKKNLPRLHVSRVVVYIAYQISYADGCHFRKCYDFNVLQLLLQTSNERWIITVWELTFDVPGKHFGKICFFFSLTCRSSNLADGWQIFANKNECIRNKQTRCANCVFFMGVDTHTLIFLTLSYIHIVFTCMPCKMHLNACFVSSLRFSMI